ncbi:MAG: nucleotide exchange factor GrpE [Candidatus Cloacimonetes bacterium]|nr:nucleotide exchange factor GrpE [Candidatus Cloacimonadota bacterium]
MSKKKKEEKTILEETEEIINQITDEEISEANELSEIEITEEKEEPTIEEKYESLLQELSEQRDKNLRIMAEFDNFRKRTIADKSSWIKNATERLVMDLCDVMDNFERALNTADEKHEFKILFDGVKMIYEQLNRILVKEGVEKIKADGEIFDPTVHEAIAHIPSELEEGKIAAIIQNGYTMNKKVIRATRVAVSNGIKPVKKDK